MSDFVTGRLGLPYLITGQAQKDVTHNEALALIDIAVASSARSMDLESPPASPDVGSCWIVSAPAAGDWEGKENFVACRISGGWRFLAPIEGMRVWIADRQLWSQWTAEGWITGIEQVAEIRIGGQAVLKMRQAAVTAPVGGTVIDAEARAAISGIIDRLRIHGLIA